MCKSGIIEQHIYDTLCPIIKLRYKFSGPNEIFGTRHYERIFTQNAFCKHVGLLQGTLSKIESIDRSIGPNSVAYNKILNAFGVDTLVECVRYWGRGLDRNKKDRCLECQDNPNYITQDNEGAKSECRSCGGAK